jgi:type IX secretion system PorP/SprF family membrane protein
MHKYILLIFLCDATFLFAQQDGYQTHFQFNEISYNPSYAGKEDNKICISSLFHQQYLGFKSDVITDYENKSVIQPTRIAPQTQYFTISGRWLQHVGIAFQFINDEIGPQQVKLPKLNLAYYFKVKNADLAFGFYAGVMQKSLDGNKLVPLSMLQPPFIPDPNVPLSMVSEKKFDMGLGIHYKNPALSNLNIGVSATHILNSDFSFINYKQQSVSFSSLKTNYYFNMATDIPAGLSKLILQPNVFMKYASRLQVDVNILAIYNQSVYGGFSFRQEDNINMMLGFFRGNFKVGYSFDFILNTLKPGTKTTHELFIQYCYSIKIKSNYLLNPRHLRDSNN